MKRTFTNNMEFLKISDRFKNVGARLFAVSLLSFLSITMAWGSGTLYLDGRSVAYASCPNSSVEIMANGFQNTHTNVEFQYFNTRTNAWEMIHDVTPLTDGSFRWALEVDETPMRVRAVTSDRQTVEITNELNISIRDDCKDICHVSSSGEYINGTDFDRKNNGTDANVNNIYQYFESSNINFTINDNQAQIHDDFQSYMGVDPSTLIDEDIIHNNSFLFTHGGNNTPFILEFKLHGSDGKAYCNHHNCSQKRIWDEEYYQVTERIYVAVPEDFNGCGDWASAQIKLETQEGSTNNFYNNADHADVVIWDITKGDDGANTPEQLYNDGIDQCFGAVVVGPHVDWNSKRGRILRIDIHFYGRFYTLNCDEKFHMKTLFQQFGCNGVKMAFDYVSADQMGVCADRGSYCMGDLATVNAAGFPYRSIYVWEEKVGNNWVPLQINGATIRGSQYNRINLPVNWIGSKTFRVYDQNTNGSTSKPMEFKIIGKNCGVQMPSTVNGPDAVCFPSNEVYEFYPDPTDRNPTANYRWVVGYDENGNGRIDQGEDTNIPFTMANPSNINGKHDNIKVNLDQNNRTGQYVVECYAQQWEEIAGQGGQTTGAWRDVPSTVEHPNPVTKTFEAYRLPVLGLELDAKCYNTQGEEVTCNNENDKQLCPNDPDQVIKAVGKEDRSPSSFDSDNRFGFRWEGATIDNDNNPYKATVEWDATTQQKACSNTNASHTVKFYVGVLEQGITNRLNVQVSDYACYQSIDHTYDFSPHNAPTIDCSNTVNSGGTKNSTTGKIEYTLGSTQSQMQITLPFPNTSGIDAGCQKDPKVTVDYKFTPKTGAVIDSKTSNKTIETTKNNLQADLGNNKVKFPAGEGVVTFTVTDGCGSTATCQIEIEVKDVTPPRIDCNSIQSFNDIELSIAFDPANPCKATPKECGGASGCLQTLVPPVLEDLNGVDGDVTGEYLGRWENDNIVPNVDNPQDRAKFSTAVGLNDPYSIGSTHILWGFTDASGNTSYCRQTIKVTDDKQPDVTCPDEFGNTGANDPAHKYVSQDDECGLSVNTLIRQLSSQPSAKDVCTGAGEAITAKIYYSWLGTGGQTTPQLVDESNYNQIIFFPDITYIIEWRFEKKNGNSYASCELKFEVEDKTPPVFDCSKLKSVRVFADNFTPSKQTPVYLDYATKETEPGPNPSGYGQVDYVGTLGSYFSDGTIKFLTVADGVEENCDKNNITITAQLTMNAAVGTQSKNLTPTTTHDLEGYKYPVGVNKLVFTFADASGNEASCEQIIQVTKGDKPEPECPPVTTIEVPVDENCQFTLTVQKDEVPHAKLFYEELNYEFNVPDAWVPANGQTVEQKAKAWFGATTQGMWGGTTRNPSGFTLPQESVKWGQMQTTTPKRFAYSDFGATAFDANFLCAATLVQEEVKGKDDNGNEIVITPAIDHWVEFNNTKWAPYTTGGGFGGFGGGGFGMGNYSLNDWRVWGLSTLGQQGYMGYTNYKILNIANEQGDRKEVDGYPYMAVLYKIPLDANGEPVVNAEGTMQITAADNVLGTIMNTYDSGESTAVRTITGVNKTQKFGDPLVCEEKVMKIHNNFQSVLFNENLPKEDNVNYRLVYYYQNKEGGEVKDSCVYIYNLVDKTEPTVVCPTDDNINLDASNAPACNAEAQGFKELTLTDLSATDNCTSAADLVLTWKRTHTSTDGSVTIKTNNNSTFTNTFELGVTEFEWIVTDASGNAATCKQVITVEDKSGPSVDCDNIKPVTLTTDDGKCEATPAVGKIRTPYYPNDRTADCTLFVDANGNVPANVEATGTRSDGVADIQAAYPKGLTTITWTFVDGLGNETTCSQEITVEDDQNPNFDCNTLQPLTYELKPTECAAPVDEIKKLLGTQTATDNCDGDVIGVPYVKDDQNNRVDLSDQTLVFTKDTKFNILWVFTDQAGNEFTCDQTLTVKDVTKPDISAVCVGDKTITKESTECTVPVGDIQLKSELEMKITDLCDGDIVPQMVVSIAQPGTGVGNIPLQYIKYTKNDVASNLPANTTTKDEITGKVSFPVTTTGNYHYVQYIYLDKAGNSDTCEYEIRIDDKSKPIIENCEDDTITLRIGDDATECVYVIPDGDLSHIINPEPTATDKCDDLLSGSTTNLTPFIVRYKVVEDLTTCLEQNADGSCAKYAEQLIEEGNSKNGKLTGDLEKGLYRFSYIFTDLAGNADTCSRDVKVLDETRPKFDCGLIDPLYLKPEIAGGDCEIPFGQFWDEIGSKLGYTAVDVCEDIAIPGVLKYNNGMTIPDDYMIKAGETITLEWHFIDQAGNEISNPTEMDVFNNQTQTWEKAIVDLHYCPQYVTPTHTKEITAPCETTPLEDLTFIATQGTCEANLAETSQIKAPETVDPCNSQYVVKGVPTVDGVEIDVTTYKFPTGETMIKWYFTSPLNLHDTAWCDQKVIVKGNKEFDFDCEVQNPPVHTTVEECDSAEPTDINDLKTDPWVADPCITDAQDPNYERHAVGVRSDGLPVTDPYPLGQTTITWTYTDFTGTVTKVCEQEVDVRSTKKLEIDCDTLANNNNIDKPAPVGECYVEGATAQEIADELLSKKLYAKHPCTGDLVEGVPSREGGLALNDKYRVGTTKIIWTFTDQTSTLVDNVITCTSFVNIGDENKVEVDCDNFPDQEIVIDNVANCETAIDAIAVLNNLKPVVDICTGKIINPTVVRIKDERYWTEAEKQDPDSYMPDVIEYTTQPKAGVTIDPNAAQNSDDYEVVLNTTDMKFKVGTDIIKWKYDFDGQIFECETHISIKNKLAPEGGCENIEDDKTINAPTGECEVPASAIVEAYQPWPVAYDVCDTNKDFPIQGKVYYNGREIKPTSTFKLPVGRNELTWVFIDESINIVGDTCKKYITIKSDLEPIFNCDDLKTEPFVTEKCDIDLTGTIKTPVAKDACTGDDVQGVGVRSDGKALTDKYPTGTTTITWTFTSPFSTVSKTCEQDVSVKTNMEPYFNCDELQPLHLSTDAKPDVCYYDAMDVIDDLLKNAPVALDVCTQTPVPGVPYKMVDKVSFDKDGNKVTTQEMVPFDNKDRFYVGETTKIYWQFINDGLENKPKICEQIVLVKGAHDPLVDCVTLSARNTKFETDDCSLVLDEENLPTPSALDYCVEKKDDAGNIIRYYAVGVRSDGKKIRDPYPIGKTTITWTFSTPYTSKTAVCEQVVEVLSKKEIDFDCDALADEPKVDVPEFDAQGNRICDFGPITIQGKVAKHPCPDESGITDIKGVPTIAGVEFTENPDGTWTVEKLHVAKHKITWTFTDPSDPQTLVKPTKVCENYIQVGELNNAAVDCKNFPDKSLTLNPEDCDISWADLEFDIKPVVDPCSGELMNAEVTRTSGKGITATNVQDGTEYRVEVVADPFGVGLDSIRWYYPTLGAECIQKIHVKDAVAPDFDCENFKPDVITLTAPDEKCEIPSSMILTGLKDSIGDWPIAKDHCTQEDIEGIVYIDGEENKKITSEKAETFELSVGSHKLMWVFFNPFINTVGDTCWKELVIKSDKEPIFECESLKPIEFTTDACSKDIDEQDIETPVGKDACTNENVVAYPIDKETGEKISLTKTYPVGITTITWKFESPYSNKTKECEQQIIVLSTQEIAFDCKRVEGIKKAITLPLSAVLDPPTSDPFAEESWIDSLHAMNPCPVESKVEFIPGVPSIYNYTYDKKTGEGTLGAKLVDMLPKEPNASESDVTKWNIPALTAGTYAIVWRFHDHSWTVKDSIKECTQMLIIEELIDTLYCPEGLNNKHIVCETELPEIYKTYEEFKAAGGRFSNEANLNMANGEVIFGLKRDEFDPNSTQFCNEIHYRSYFVQDIRGHEITCEDTIFIKDTVPPVFIEMTVVSQDANDYPNKFTSEEMTLSCDEEVPEEVQPKVEDCDPSVTLTYKEESTQGDDPSLCDYYTYDLTRTWTATDRCDNVSVYSRVIHIVDNETPVITLPSNWGDTVLSILGKECKFLVPDFVARLNNDTVIHDNCADLQYVTITQNPEAGSTIYETTMVNITIKDPCGKTVELQKGVYAPRREDVVQLEVNPINRCVSDEDPLDMMGAEVRWAEGSYLYEDVWDHTVQPMSSSFEWDIFKEGLTEDNIIYSTNPNTYGKKFAGLTTEQSNMLYKFDRRSQSSEYYIVATDTITGCADTASVRIELKERPRISMESDLVAICEFNHVDEDALNNYVNCVNEMGTPILGSYWTYGGVEFNFADDTILYEGLPYKDFVYATYNECDTTTSLNTLAESCGTLATVGDSLAFVDGENENLALLRTEDYYTRDSIKMEVHKRFNPDSIRIKTDPRNPSRIWQGESVDLELITPYHYEALTWYKVVKKYDRRDYDERYSEKSFVYNEEDLEDEHDEVLMEMNFGDTPIITDSPEDTARYYATITDNVCPSVASWISQVDVILHIPTAFTPYVREGLNDVFVERHHVMIFDRYGMKVFEGDNGWDGTKGGKLVDPGVYFYSVTMNDGSTRKGTIEVVFLNNR